MNRSKSIPKYTIVYLSILVMMISFSSAVSTLAPIKVGQCINLPQVCDNCTYVNITKILSPTSASLLTNAAMTKNGNQYNYTFCNNAINGEYLVTTCGNLNGEVKCDSYTYEVNPSGTSGGLGMYIILIAVIFTVGFFGFFGKHVWISMLGGMAMIGLGVFTLNTGIDVYRNFMTEMFSWTSVGIGAIFALTAGVELINENL